MARQLLTFGEHILAVLQTFRAYITGQATAGSAKTWPLLVAEADIVVRAVRWVPSAAVTGDDTNNFALAVQNKGDDGQGTTAVTATKTYATGTDSVAFVPETLTLSATEANLNLDAGEVLALVRTVTGSGLVSPDGAVEVEYDYR